MREAAAMGEGQEDPGSTPTTTPTTTTTTDQPAAGQSTPAGGPATDQASGHQPQEGVQEEVTMTTEEEEEDQEERELIESQGPSRIPVNGLGGTGGRRKGKCKWFNVLKGFGFITPHDGTQDIFVHQSVIQMTGFRSLGEGEEVEFECKPSDKGIEATFVSGPESSDCKGSDRRPMGKKKYKKIRCYNCGDFGNHIAAKCPHGPLPKRCHFCKAEDHLIADCPHRDHTSHPSGQDSDSSPDDAPSNGSSGGGDGTGSSPGGSGTGNGDGGGAAAASEGAESSSSAPAQTTETPAS